MKDKEEKAKEYALSFFKDQEITQYDLQAIDEIERDFLAGFEAGKQEREREIVEKIKEWKELHKGDLSLYNTFSIVVSKLNKFLENLSK